MKNKYKTLYVVHWDDAWSSGVWRSEIEQSPLSVVTAGFLHKHDKKGISLYGRYCENDDLGNVSFIPAGMITKIIKTKVKIN